MKQIFINDDNLRVDELDDTVIRVKAMIINSQGEILLAHNNGTYQFPGGHKEDDEDMEDTLIREIKEETGIEIEDVGGPFVQIVTYDSNYFGTGRKMCSKIYYFIINTDEMPDYQKTNYDELELQSEFNLVYTDVSTFSSFLDEAVIDGMMDPNICREMKIVAEEYNRIYG